MSSTALQRIPRASASLKTAWLTPGAEEAAITRYAPSRSAGANAFARHSTFPCAIHCAMAGVTCGATTRTRASAAKRPSIFPSATAPPPTTTTRRSRSFTKMGSKLMLALDSHRHGASRRVAFNWSDEFPGQPSTNLLVRVAREKSPQILSGYALLVEFTQQPLDGVRHFRRRAAITDGPCDRRKLAHAATNAEVIRVDHPAIDFQLFAFDADVRDPVLAAAIRASGDVQLELLLKPRQALIELFGEPARETFRFCERQFAKFRARARNRAARESGSAHRQAHRGQLAGDSRSMLVGYIHDQQVLHDGVAEMPVCVPIGEIGSGTQLLRRYAPAQHVRADIGEALLLLRVNADVVAMNIRGKLFRLGWIEREAQSILQCAQEGIRRPAVLQEKKLQPRTLAVLAEHFRFTKELRHAAYHGDSLLPPHESVQANAKLRIGGKTASHAQRKSDLIEVQSLSRDSSKSDIIDLGIRAPRMATGDRNLELARQIVELGIAAKLAIQLQRQRRSIAIFVRVKTRQGASRNVPRDVAACAGGCQPRAPKRLKHLRQGLDGHPVQLHVLPHRDVRNAARVALGEVGDGARLLTAQEAVGNSDAHHKERRRLAFAILAADHADAVALRVDAPRAKIRAEPFRRNRSVALPRKRADLIEMLPGILLAFQPLHALRFGFLDFAHICSELAGLKPAPTSRA